MKCNLCNGKGMIKIERFGRINQTNCYICEGIGEVEHCIDCNGSGEKVIKRDGLFDFSPCLVCVGNGLRPKQEDCGCNGKGYHWIQENDNGDPFYYKDACHCLYREAKEN